MTTSEQRRIEAAIKDAVVLAHPDVVFTAVWVEPRTSWCGDDMLEVWAVYDGDTDDLAVPSKPSLGTRIQDILWDLRGCGPEHAPRRQGGREGPQA